jgi:Flp pilus assembly pilin Flp
LERLADDRYVELRPGSWHSHVLFGAPSPPRIDLHKKREESMLYMLFGYLHAAVVERVRRIQRLAGGESGQGTVEYVGLILLVSLLMVGMVAAMKGFNGKQGTELADVIVNKIKEAVDKVAFK